MGNSFVFRIILPISPVKVQVPLFPVPNQGHFYFIVLAVPLHEDFFITVCDCSPAVRSSDSLLGLFAKGLNLMCGHMIRLFNQLFQAAFLLGPVEAGFLTDLTVKSNIQKQIQFGAAQGLQKAGVGPAYFMTMDIAAGTLSDLLQELIILKRSREDDSLVSGEMKHVL